MKITLLILYISLLCFKLSLTANVKELSTGNYTEETISDASFKLYYSLKNTGEKVSGASLYLENIPQENVKVYLDDYNSETIAEDFIPKTDGKEEYILHKIRNENIDHYYMMIFNQTENVNNKIISIVINNINSSDPKFKIIGIKPESAIPTLGTSYLKFIKIKQNIPLIIPINLMRSRNHGLTYMFFVPSKLDHIKLIHESKLYDGEVILLNKAEVLTFPKLAEENERFNYYAIIFGQKEEKTQFSVVTTELQTLYFSNKEERTNDRSYDIRIENAYQKFFALGEYESESDSLIYLEEVLGRLTTYYSNTLNGKTIKNMLPDEKDGVKLNNDFLRVYSDIDILTVYCDSMCMFNLHMISMTSINSNTTEVGKTKYILLNKYIQKERKIEIINNNLNNEKTLFYEVASIDKKDVSFEFLDESNNKIGETHELDFFI